MGWMAVMHHNPYPWQKLNLFLLTLVFVEQAPRKVVQSYSGFAVQRYMLLLESPNFRGAFLCNRSIFLYFSITWGCLTWCHVFQRHVGTLVVVELHSLGHCPSDLAYGVEFDVLEQFVLDGVVLALSHSIVLGVSALRHTDLDTCFDEQWRVCGADLLYATVRVVDKVDGLVFGQRLQSLHQASIVSPTYQAMISFV